MCRILISKIEVFSNKLQGRGIALCLWFWVCFCMTLLFSNNVMGQITGCSGTFYDSGGASGNYGDNQNTTVTYCPTDPTTQVIQIVFTSFSVEGSIFPECDYDFLQIFNGNSTSTTSLGIFCDDTGSPGTVTSTHSSGCLTFRFVSDPSFAQAGWAATISCVAPGGGGGGGGGGGSCPATVGTVNITGATNTATNVYELAFGGTANFSATGTILPTVTGPDPAGLTWNIFSCAPQAANYDNPQADPCYLGTDFNTATSSTNDGTSLSGTYSSVWVLPVTFDDACNDIGAGCDSGAGPDEYPFPSGDGCVAYGTPIELVYLPNTPTTNCDCADPSCEVGAVANDASLSFLECEIYAPALNNETITTCHIVTASSTGFLGLSQSMNIGGVGPDESCINVTLASRTVELYAINGGDCTGSPIAPNIANGGNSATFNPEWNNLTANTDYIACVSLTVSSACQITNTCLDYYGDTAVPPSGTCDCVSPCAAHDRGTVNGSTIYQDCVTENIPLFGAPFPAFFTEFTNCYDVQADANGNLGLIQSFTTTPPACANSIGSSRVVELYPVAANCTGSPIVPTTANAGNFSETFNPEWTGLTANGNYIACITTTVDETCDYGEGCLDYYGIPSTCSITPQNATAANPCQNDALTLNASSFYTGTATGTLSYAWSSAPNNIITGSTTGSSVTINTSAIGTNTITLTLTEGADACGSGTVSVAVQDCTSSCVENAGTYTVAIDGVNQGSSCGTFNIDSHSEITWTSNGDQVLASGGNSGIVYVIFDQDPSGFDLTDVNTFIPGATGVLGGDPDNTAPFTTEETNCAGISGTNATWPSTVYVIPVTADFASIPYTIDTDFDGCVNAGCITTLNYTYTNTFTLGCGDTFTDTGGVAGDYCNNENTSWTICPDTPSDPVEVNFINFETEGISTCYDNLTIYNGNNTSAPILENQVCEESAINPNPVVSTATNGCLHFVFISDGGVTDFGWEATVNCSETCSGTVQFIKN